MAESIPPDASLSDVSVDVVEEGYWDLVRLLGFSDPKSAVNVLDVLLRVSREQMEKGNATNIFSAIAHINDSLDGLVDPNLIDELPNNVWTAIDALAEISMVMAPLRERLEALVEAQESVPVTMGNIDESK